MENQNFSLSQMNPALPTGEDHSLHFYDLCSHNFFFFSSFYRYNTMSKPMSPISIYITEMRYCLS